MKYPEENEIKAAKIKRKPKNEEKQVVLRLKERNIRLYNHVKTGAILKITPKKAAYTQYLSMRIPIFVQNFRKYANFWRIFLYHSADRPLTTGKPRDKMFSQSRCVGIGQ